MPDPNNPASNPESASVSGPQHKPTRRRLLQGGLAAAPVLMTLVSRPVLAQQCTTPSGYVSLNASTAGRGVACTGRTPAYWKNTRPWPTPYSPTTPFITVFIAPSPYAATTTLLDVLSLQGGGRDDVARHIVAALLNVAKGWAPVLTLAVLKDMWSEYLANNTFSPSSGATWSQKELIDYLLKTMPS